MRISRVAGGLISFAGLTVIAIMAVIYVLIDGVSNGANSIDDARTRQSVELAFAAVIEQMESLVSDNAKWDYAVDNSYGSANQDWINDTWGEASADPNYDTVYVIDGAGNPVSGFSGGDRTDMLPNQRYGDGLQKLIVSLPMDKTTFKTAAGFVLTQAGAAVVAVAPILPYSPERSIPSDKPLLLVFSKTLTPDYVSMLGERQLLKGFRLQTNVLTGENTVPLVSSDGATIMHVVWDPRRPGDSAKAAMLLPALLSIAAVVACMGLLIGHALYFARGLRRSEREAWHVAHTDKLTGLPNRIALVEHATNTINANIGQGPARVSVILADIDGFKDVNDTYGHDIGDLLLIEIAKAFSEVALNYNVFVGRLGGDEFALVAQSADISTLSGQVSNDLLAALSKPFNIQGRIAHVGVSLGVSICGKGDADPNEIIRRADVAMYTAKAEGKNRWRVYEPDLDERRNRRVAMAEELHAAVERGLVNVVYQPIVDADSKRITGVEALARWNSPKFGQVSPEDFVSVAEEFGIIEDLGFSILSKACVDALEWKDIALSVNVSPAQFRNPNFVSALLKVVDRSGLDYQRLALEVTESYVIEHKLSARRILQELQALGFKVVLDDFGTGYSSFGYLRDYHFDRLKLDRSLVCESLNDPTAMSIVAATLEVARNLNMDVTAEGVESREQADMMSVAGCTKLQGYLFGRPQSASSITALLAKPAASKAA
jgi:diguanylate cyclase (GGDEF)-like protein